ncbi:hypothetical protein V1Y59_04060 [Gordonia sp. PKS22-38]|uniref:Uncharacterized protein n=1 Tax=Gordonia prachuapensis TaxID=3115651 RepID=A0ABU7MPI8_9ACTN|nr:hypothetical protein [Gordonia sp. PKS22-38]
MADDSDGPDKWRQLSTYFTGKLSMFITYPILTFALGVLIGYFTSSS